jgi:hypothetical protein
LVTVRIGVHLIGQVDLPQVVRARRSVCSRSRALQRRKQHADEHRDDADDDEQFDERERCACTLAHYRQFDEREAATAARVPYVPHVTSSA